MPTSSSYFFSHSPVSLSEERVPGAQQERKNDFDLTKEKSDNFFIIFSQSNLLPRCISAAVMKMKYVASNGFYSGTDDKIWQYGNVNVKLRHNNSSNSQMGLKAKSVLFNTVFGKFTEYLPRTSHCI